MQSIQPTVVQQQKPDPMELTTPHPLIPEGFAVNASSTTENNNTKARRKKKRAHLTPPTLDNAPPLLHIYGGPITADGRMVRLTNESETNVGLRLHRIFYFSSFVNLERQKFMEGWMKPLGVPYQRIEPMTGAHSLCATRECLESLQLSTSYRRFPTASWVYDTSGTVLVVDDDGVTVDIGALDRFLSNFTEKWNVLRLECDTPSPDDPDVVWYPQPAAVIHGEHRCARSNAILWRRQSLNRLKDRLSRSPSEDLDVNCLLAKKVNYKTICLNLGITQKHHVDEKQKAPVRESWVLHDIGWSIPQMRHEAARMPTRKPNSMARVDRIYYHNLDKNTLRRQHMESWLSEQPIVYKRVPAQIGEPDGCIENKNTPNRCRGMSGIAKTLTGILDNENTTGVSLVLEDDVIPMDKDRWSRMMEAIKYVPDDWDIIRFDCWGANDYGMRYVNGFVVDTRKPKIIKNCADHGVCQAFCGGAYAMLWRDSSAETLKKMWRKVPVDDADCIIGKTEFVQSYCVNIGLWEHFYINNEISDVSLLED
jgi:hypothetical protein